MRIQFNLASSCKPLMYYFANACYFLFIARVQFYWQVQSRFKIILLCLWNDCRRRLAYDSLWIRAGCWVMWSLRLDGLCVRHTQFLTDYEVVKTHTRDKMQIRRRFWLNTPAGQVYTHASWIKICILLCWYAFFQPTQQSTNDSQCQWRPTSNLMWVFWWLWSSFF